MAKAAEKIVAKVVYMAVNYVKKNPDHILEVILGVGVLVLAKVYVWSPFKTFTRWMCGCTQPTQASSFRQCMVFSSIAIGSIIFFQVVPLFVHV